MNTIRIFISLLFTIGYLIHAPLSAQSRIDSLLLAVEQAPEQSIEKIETLITVCRYYFRNDPRKSLYYAEEIQKTGEAIKDSYYIARGHHYIGTGMTLAGVSPDKALAHYLQAQEVCKENTGEQFRFLQEQIYINISALYLNNAIFLQGNALVQSKNILLQNREFMEASNNLHNLGLFYESISTVYLNSKQIDSSLYYIDRAIITYQEVEAQQRLAHALLNKGRIYAKDYKPERALQIYFEAMDIAYTIKDTLSIIYGSIYTVNAYHTLKDYETAKTVAHKCLSLNPAMKYALHTLSLYETIHNIFLAQEQYDSALHYYKTYTDLHNQILDKEKIRAVEDVEAKYELKEHERVNQELTTNLALQQQQKISLLIASVLFLAFLLIVSLLYRKSSQRKAKIEHLYQDVHRVNAQLVSIIEEKRHMVSFIAHDIRNPLSLIYFNTRILTANSDKVSLQDKHELTEEIETAAKKIDIACLEIMEIENNIERVAQIKTDNFDLNPILLETEKEFQAYAKSKHIKLQFSLPMNKPFFIIKGDSFLFKHIMINIISNALKYSPYRSIVKVEMKEADDHIIISVTDQGPGIASIDQQRIFEQGATTTNTPTGGESKLGRGLYLTKRYVEAMNGTIKVDSQKGRGATFKLAFLSVN